MYRVSSKPIQLPKGVAANIQDSVVTVKGPKGELSLNIHPIVSVQMDKDAEFGEVVKCQSNDPKTDAMAGTMRALIQNMVTGVSEGFSRQLEMNGVGYRGQVKGKTLQLNLGFSHPVDYEIPKEVDIEMPNNTTIILKSADKQKVGQTAAEIRAFRPPEPYKGKGIKYAEERIIRKETKKK